MNLKNYLKRTATLLLSACMVLTIPLQAFAYSTDLIPLSNKSDPINTLAVTPYKLKENQKTTDLLIEKDQPDIYTFRTNFKVQKVVKNGVKEYKKNYQPYVASVGADISEEDKAKVNKEIKLPDLKGYEKPQDTFSISYDEIKSKAENGTTIKKMM